MSSETVTTYQQYARLIIRLLITILALAVCSYQVYIVSDLYYSYPTTVDIRLDPSAFVQLPAITICSELSSTILVEELVKLEPSLYKVFAGKTRTEISLMLKKRKMREMLLDSLHSLPIDQQHQLTVTSNKFFKQCQLPTPMGRYISNTKNETSSLQFLHSWDIESYKKINCSQLSPIVETISYEFKCFSLFLNQTMHLGRDINYQIPKDVVANFKYLAWIQLNRDFIFNGLIYIHSPEIPHQYATTSNIQQLDPDKHQFVSISFDKEIIQLLPPPYATKCRNYLRNGYLCRDDCITKCKVDRYLKLDGWPGDVYANKSVKQHFSKLWSNAWSSAGHLEEGVDAESLASCSYQCGHSEDCESVQYDVRTVRVRERDEQDRQESHSFTVGILPPKSVQLINRHMPKFEPIEFLVYIGSLVSLYLGVSVVSTGVNLISFMTFTSKTQAKMCQNCCGGDTTPNDKNGKIVKRKDKTIYQNLPEQNISHH